MNCRLRLIREHDLPDVMKWRMLPEVTRFMYTDPLITLEHQKAWFEHISRSERDRVWIIEVASNRGVGLLSLSEIDRGNSRCSWAYYIADSSVRGMGLARVLELNIYAYVFEQLRLNKLCCEVFAFNEKVVALHERYGSKVEGVLRQHICKDGKWFDVVRMGILRSEWEATRDQWTLTPIDIETPEAPFAFG